MRSWIDRSQAIWLALVPTDKPTRRQLSASNSFCMAPNNTNSDVQIGVKSEGWEKRMTHLPLKSSGKRILPLVVSASNDGALSPISGIV